MKIGVVFHEYNPQGGGGYTYETEILNALMHYEIDSRHSFVLITEDWHLSEKIADAPHIQFLSLTDPIVTSARFASQRLISRIWRGIFPDDDQRHRLYLAIKRRLQIFPSITPSSAQKQPPDSINQLLAIHHVDLLWYPSQGHALTLDIPYIATVWDLQHRLQPFFPDICTDGQWECREEFYARTLRRATFVITSTREGQREIEYFYQIPPERIRILPFPTPDFALQADHNHEVDVIEKYHLPPNFLFYPAQFWTGKNHANLLLALKMLRETEQLHIPIVFVGSDHGNLAYIQKLVQELGLSDLVHFLGFVSQEELVALYRQAFALTMLTFFGPDNLPPLEAFALGCPVIASNVPGATEQLADAALLVDPKNECDIARSIKLLYDQPELRQQLIQRGLQRAQTWTGKDFIAGFLKMLDEFAPVRRAWGY